MPIIISSRIGSRWLFQIKEAYLKLISVQEGVVEEKESESSLETKISNYMMLFYQHYCYQSLKDQIICPDLVIWFGTMCACAFKRDIVKSTIDLCKAVSEEDSAFNKTEVLTEYLKAINESQHKNFIDLRNIFEQNIHPDSLLQNAIEQCKTDGVYLELFGITNPEQ